MNLIESSVEFFPPHYTIDEMFEDIEYAGRVCYASDKTKKTSREFTEMLINKGHLSPLEFGTVYLLVDLTKCSEQEFGELYVFYMSNPFSKIVFRLGDEKTRDVLRITTNYRVLVENGRTSDLKYWHNAEKDKLFIKRMSVKFTCSIAISREFNRHRCHSIAEQSTRYCNFSKDKFGNELTFIIPYWYDQKSSFVKWLYRRLLSVTEWFYLKFVKWFKLKPQEAREVLPLSTKTVLCHSAYIPDWYHFFSLRSASSAHPDAQKLSKMVEKGLSVLYPNLMSLEHDSIHNS